MPKLKPFPAKKVLKKLKKIGFEEVHQRGSHLQLMHADGRAVTIPMHGAKDIPVGTLHNIVIHQAQLTVEEFLKI